MRLQIEVDEARCPTSLLLLLLLLLLLWLSAWLKCPIGLGREWTGGHHYYDYELTIAIINIYPAWLK